MLLTKEVEVQASYQTYKYYEDLGYEIPRNKKGGYSREKFKVKIEHLTKGSQVKVDVSCDGNCKKILHPKYQDYCSHNHNGKYYCQSCYSRLFMSGENAPNWNPNKTKKDRVVERNYPEYMEFVRIVLARDNYTCQCCGKHGVDLDVHHLDGYNWCIEKRTDETNGITLCKNCHSNFHANYGYGDNTKEQFEEWFGRTIKLVKCGIEIPPTRKIYCIETDTIYDGANDVCKKLKIKSPNPIYKLCNKQEKSKSVNGYHFLWYDEYINMTQKDIDDFMDYCSDNYNHKVIICLETKEIFDSCTEAASKYATSEISGTSNIVRSCRNIGMTSYCTEDGLSLHWMYYDEYLTKTQQEIYDIKHTFGEARPIICLSYNIVYKNAAIASRECGVKISNTSINTACKKRIGQTGKLPNKHKLTWMYYDLFVELPIKEQNRILNEYKESFPNGSFVM